MKQSGGSPHLYLASSQADIAPAAKAKERLRSVLATLEQCHAVLLDEAERDAAQLLSITILQLRMNLYQVGDAELRALCDAALPDAKNSDLPRTLNG